MAAVITSTATSPAGVAVTHRELGRELVGRVLQVTALLRVPRLRGQAVTRLNIRHVLSSIEACFVEWFKGGRTWYVHTRATEFAWGSLNYVTQD